MASFRWEPVRKIDATYVRECLIYDPETGELTWKERPKWHFSSHAERDRWNGRFSGCVAGRIGKIGYLTVNFSNRVYPAHRLAWVVKTGAWPKDYIDHVNGVKSDNRFVNLREATVSENVRNSVMPKNNTSGIKGVSWSERSKKWVVYLQTEGKNKQLGYFKNKADAEEVVRAAREKAHGEFANHGEKRDQVVL